MIQYSVIIPAYNSEKTISTCLQALLEQNYNKAVYEIIVVDDGSHDRTREKVMRVSEAGYLYQKNQGPACARNYGVENARGKIVLFIDSDCEATANWLEEMSRPFDDPEIMGVKGAYLTKQTHWVAKFVQLEYETKYEKMKHDQYIDFVDTYSAAFRKEMFMQAGGYSAIFPTASVEDQKFSFRLEELGCKMIFNPRAQVYHQHVDRIGKYFWKKMKIAYWKVLVLKSHPRKIWRDSHTPQTLKMEMVCIGGSAFSVLCVLLTWNKIILFCGMSLFFIFILLAIYEMRKTFLKNIWIGILTIPMLFLRSLALGIGLLLGIVVSAKRRTS